MGIAQKYTKQELTESLKNYIEIVGYIPTKKEIKEKRPLVASIRTYEYRFGSWAKAVESTGNTPRKKLKKAKKVKVFCKNCKKEIFISENAIKPNHNNFCSRSCAATYNNKRKPKRKPEGTCKTCKTPIKTIHTYCGKCREVFYKEKTINIDEITLEEATYFNQQASNRYCRVRDRAKTLYRKFTEKCFMCGYTKHADICHIKAIKDFSQEDLVKDINAPSNITILCKNCHWELDHNILHNPPTIADILSKNKP